jgi:WXG100 family type VII secretion target
MVDVSVGYEGLQNAAGQLRTGQQDMDDKLQSLRSVIDELVGGEFRTQLASGKFQESYQQWSSGAQNMLEGLEGMAGFLGEVVTRYQELDSSLAQGGGGLA